MDRNRRGLNLTPHLHLVQKSRMYRAIFPHSSMSSAEGLLKKKTFLLFLLPCLSLFSHFLNLGFVAFFFNPLNPELNPICYLLALLGDHHFLHVSRIRVKLLTFRLLMSYLYGAPILDVSRSHTTTQHSR